MTATSTTPATTRPRVVRNAVLASLPPLLMLLAACGDDDTTSGDTVANVVSEIPQLTFDGSDCVYEGPEDATAGVVAVEFVNDSDRPANVQVMLLDQGTTVQDYTDQFSQDQPSSHYPPFASDMGGQPPATAGETITWKASLAAGQYVALCGNRENAWFGFGLTVVDG
jgi:hypothetical protein